MALHILPAQEGWKSKLGASLGTGLGQGLAMLAQKKMDEIDTQKEVQLFQQAGYTPEAANLLVHLRKTSQQSPGFDKILGMVGEGGAQQPQQIQQQAQSQQMGSAQAATGGPQVVSIPDKPREPSQPLFSNKPKSEAHALKIEARKDKLRPDLSYLDDLERTANELRELINEQKDPVEFGLKSAALSSIPYLGEQFLGGSTGAFNALSNKFHTDAAQNSKGVRSVYHVKILGASKPSLSKTKEQNERILNHWDKVISEKKAKFLKAHPEFIDEIEKGDQSSQKNAQSAQQDQPKSGSVRINNGQKEAWDPNTQKWRKANW